MSFTSVLLDRTKQLASEVDSIDFTFDGYIYNPLNYAWDLHSAFLSRYVKENAKVLFLGMNPGPFGMMQSGVPFGEVNAVKGYLGLFGTVNKPLREHPSRPVVGLDCKRSEVSGKRLWGLISEVYPSADLFALDNCVFNYCPLGFLMKISTAKNFTPDHLPKEERVKLDSVCDSYLKDIVDLIGPKFLIGVGKYAKEKLLSVGEGRTVDSIIHPSPGNPQANDNWNGKTLEKIRSMGLWK